MIRDLVLTAIVILAITAVALHQLHRLYDRELFVHRCKQFGEVEKCEMIYERSVDEGLH